MRTCVPIPVTHIKRLSWLSASVTPVPETEIALRERFWRLAGQPVYLNEWTLVSVRNLFPKLEK